MDYKDKHINSMILFLRINNIAEIQYIDRQITAGADTGDLTFYDYKSDSHITREQLIASALESGWKKDWNA
jgi:hypothetical protein